MAYNKSESETVTDNVPTFQSYQLTTVGPKFMTIEEVDMLRKMYNEKRTLLGKKLALKENECKFIHNRYIDPICLIKY